MPHRKISLIGATGRIGREVIRQLYQQFPEQSDTTLEVQLFHSTRPQSSDRLAGYLLDFTNSLFLSQTLGKKIHFHPTSDYQDLRDSRVVIITVGRWPTATEQEKFSGIDPGGRTVQSVVNYGLMQELGQHITTYAPQSLVLNITNQVNVMSEALREQVPHPKNILGVGGLVDSARLRQVLWEELRNLNEWKDLEPQKVEGHMMGYHNYNMLPLLSSIRIRGRSLEEWQGALLNYAELWPRLLEQVRNMGPYISHLQKDTNQINLASGVPADTGANLTPAAALVKSTLTIVGCKAPFVGCFDVRLDEAKSAEFYGVPLHSSLSVPITLATDGWTPCYDYKPNGMELQALKAMQQELQKEIQLVHQSLDTF